MSIFYFIIQQTMIFSIPLLVVALGALFSERSGVTNIAMEGIMILGAFAGVLFMKYVQPILPGQPVFILSLLVAGITGMIVSLLHAYASINMNADQTISGTAINTFAPAFAIYTARIIQQVQQVSFINQFQIKEVPILSKIPILGGMFFKNAYISTDIGVLILVVSWFLLYKTKFGLRLRACGEFPQAADSVGVNVYKIRYAGVIISGLLGGMGGLIFVVPTSVNFNASVAGYGFLAIAVLIFGQWKPMKIFFAAIFFGLMKTLASAYSTIPFMVALNIPTNFYKMAPYIATIIVLIFTSKNSQAPKACGTPYDKEQR